jgi:hypothetical protein
LFEERLRIPSPIKLKNNTKPTELIGEALINATQTSQQNLLGMMERTQILQFNFKNFLFVFILGISFPLFSQENKVYEVEIKGAKKTKISFINNLIKTKKENLLDSLTLDHDIVLLKRLAAISHAYYQVFELHKGFYNVFIYVEEHKTIIPSINFWTSINQQFSYNLGLYDYNFLGRNITFGALYQNNGFDSYGASFIAPNLFSRKWGISFNFKNWKSEGPLYFDIRSANYLYNNISYEVLGLYQYNINHQFNFGISFFSEKYQYLSGDLDATIPTKLDLNKKLIKLVYTFDKLDYYYHYIEGFKSVLYAQYVTTTSAFKDDFFIAWNDFFYFDRISEKGNWANRLRVGLSSNKKTPFAPFALDNNINLRGVGIFVDRGTGSLVLNSEYRHTVYDKNWLAIQSNFFVDAGSWRNPGGSLNDFTQKENTRIYSGIGLRFISKKVYNTTFRIDYGFKVFDGTNQSNGGLVFGIGQYF